METQIGIAKPEFTSGRKNLILEVGPSGPSTIISPVMQKYMERSDSNYLGVDIDPAAEIMFDIFTKDMDWAREVTMDITKIEGLDNKVSEIWTQNFKGMQEEQKNESNLKILKKYFSLLQKGGKLIFINTYDNYSDEQEKMVMDNIKKSGFVVSKLENLEDKNNHPFISYYLDLQKDLINESMKRVVLIGTKP